MDFSGPVCLDYVPCMRVRCDISGSEISRPGRRMGLSPVNSPYLDRSYLVGLAAGVPVGSAGDVYVTDSDNKRAVKLAAGSSTQTVLSFSTTLRREIARKHARTGSAA